MKKNIILSVVGVAATGLLLASCSAKPESVTAVVAGPDGQPSAVVVKYAKAVSAESVTADAFQIDGQEIETVFVTDKDITTPPAKSEGKPECNGEHKDCHKAEAGKGECCSEDKNAPKHGCDKAGKADCCEAGKAVCDSTKACPEGKAECDKAGKADCKGPKSVDGQYVVIVLKKACPEGKADCCEAGKAVCDSTKACPEGKAECDKAGKADCCQAGKAGCDSTKACPEGKADCCEAGKAGCDSTKACPEGKAECDKAQKSEVVVPDVKVNQVKDIKAVDGSVLKAWVQAYPATKAVPCMKKGPKHHHGKACPEGKADCCEAGKAECGKAECDKAGKAECCKDEKASK